VRYSSIDVFRCPACGRRLEAREGVEASPAPDREIVSGVLECLGGAHRFDITRRLPRFQADSGYAASFGDQWNRFRKTQLDRFNGTTLSRDRFFSGTRWTPEALRGARVLEVGCGAGRFTQVLLDTGASVHSVDYSSAVDACLANNDDPRLIVAQADVYHLPFERASFDYVFCYGVLQHTPHPQRAFEQLVAFVKPGGRIAIDSYRKAWELQPYKSKYLWRPLTTRMPRERLLRLIQWYVPMWLPLDTVIKKLPLVGNTLGMFVPCWNYCFLPLTRQQQVEWAILDTFDALSPAYDLPQSEKTIREWFERAGLENIDVRVGGNGVLGNGRASEARTS
jgi:SAM-dependent methyltransferase